MSVSGFYKYNRRNSFYFLSRLAGQYPHLKMKSYNLPDKRRMLVISKKIELFALAHILLEEGEKNEALSKKYELIAPLMPHLNNKTDDK